MSTSADFVITPGKYTHSMLFPRGLDAHSISPASQSDQEFLKYIQNKKSVATIGMNSDGELQAFFRPTISTSGQATYLVGNMSNDKRTVCFAACPMKDFGYYLLVDKFANIPPNLRPTHPLKDSFFHHAEELGSAQEDLGLFLCANKIHIYPGMTAPDGNINSDECIQAFADISDEFAIHGNLLRKMFEDHDSVNDDVAEVLKVIREQENPEDYIGNYAAGKDCIVENPWVLPSVFTNKTKHKEAVKYIEQYFARPITPTRPTATSTTFASSNVTQPTNFDPAAFQQQLQQNLRVQFDNIVVKSSTEVEKEKDASLARSRLTLVGMAFDWDPITGAMTNPQVPTFTKVMGTVFAASATQRNARMSMALKTTFKFVPKKRTERSHPFYQDRDMKVFTKPFLTAIVNGDFSTEGVDDMVVETSALAVPSFVGQNMHETLSRVTKEQQEQENEDRQSIPDTQRKQYNTFIQPLGTVSKLDDVVTLYSNTGNVLMTIYDVEVLEPLIYNLIEVVIDEIKSPSTKDWLRKMAAEMSHAPWIWIEFLSTILKSFGSFSQNSINVSVIDNKLALAELDTTEIDNLGIYLKAFTDRLNLCKISNSNEIPVPSITPSFANPHHAKMLQLKASVTSFGGASATSFGGGGHDDTSTPTSHGKRNGAGANSAGSGLGNDTHDSRKRSKKDQNDVKRSERRKKMGWMILKKGKFANEIMPKGFDKKEIPCFNFCCLGYDCSRHESACDFMHAIRVSNVDKKVFDAICENMTKNKAGYLCAETLDRQGFKLNDTHKHLLGDASKRT